VLKAGIWNLGLWSGAWWQSLQAEIDTRQPVVQGDFIWGAVYVGTGSFPLAWTGYFGASVEFQRNITNPNGTDWSGFNVSVSSSFIASSFLGLSEKNASGAEVTFLPFNTIIWFFNKTASISMTNVSAGIHAFVFEGARLGIGWPVVQIQYIVTEDAGTLNLLDGVMVVPRAIESIILINGWQYQSESNQLALRTAIGSLQSSGTVDGQISAGSGDNRVFFRFASKVQVDGVMVPAAVGVGVEKDIALTFQNKDVVAQLTGRYQAQAACQVVEVIFPAGAQSIAYDPTMGSGVSPYDQPTDTPNNTALIVGVVIGSVAFVAIIIFGVACYVRRSASYVPVK